jgi:serine/threonine-protein kinase
MSIRPVKHDTAVKLTILSKPVVEKKPAGILFERIEQVSCPHCGSFVTLTEARPLSLIPCKQCGGKVFVAVRLANFLIHSSIGEGEMGTIYRATDESLGRDVAIKLIRGSYVEDPEACERLRKEARALGRLNHPRVAQVYALSFSNGHPYLVMELVTGEDFEKKVEEEGHLDERVVLRMAGDVAEGLAALNREGLVHSDIKPANIVMDRDGNSKLVDFGLTGMSRYDSHHNLMGTPDYIAPELIFGEEDTPRSDIFSLGATLYHLLAGHTPTPGADPKDVIKARADQTPITPLQEVAPHVSPATCKMVMKMLEHKKEDRLQNSDILAYEVKEALRLLDSPSAVTPALDAFGNPQTSSSSQEETTPLTDADKASARGGLSSLYG